MELARETNLQPESDGLSRRQLLRSAGAAVAMAASGGIAAVPLARPVLAAASTPETLVTQLYASMTSEQKAAVCFDWDHPKRLMISNNWHIVPQRIGEFYKPDQQDLIRQIFNGAHNEEWIPQRLKQMKDDAGSFEKYSIAIFGTPGTKKFEWVMTGRHLTLRVDGDSEPGLAFGGPIFYGHAAQGFNEKPDHPGNVYWYQALRANEVFKALDGNQRKEALVGGAVPAENPSMLIPKPAAQRPGIPVASLSRDQRELVEKVLADVLQPVRKADQDEARRYIKKGGGVESLHLAYYTSEDVGNDGVWDVWRLEGPTMVWYFRGSPHVHTWVHISEKPITREYPSPA